MTAYGAAGDGKARATITLVRAIAACAAALLEFTMDLRRYLPLAFTCGAGMERWDCRPFRDSVFSQLEAGNIFHAAEGFAVRRLVFPSPT